MMDDIQSAPASDSQVFVGMKSSGGYADRLLHQGTAMD
jgi:hypothetical protein